MYIFILLIQTQVNELRRQHFSGPFFNFFLDTDKLEKIKQVEMKQRNEAMFKKKEVKVKRQVSNNYSGTVEMNKFST